MSDWCKLGAGYYRDPAVVRAGEAAEVLFTRGLAYCTEHGTDGRIPREAVPLLTPTKGAARASSLVRERLWLIDGDDYLVRSWSHWQEGRDALEDRRRKDRQRKATARRAARGSSAEVSADMSADFRATEVEVDTDKEDVLRTSCAVMPLPRSPAIVDPLWDAVMSACGIESIEVTRSVRSGYNRAVNELRAVGATADEVHHRASNYRQHFRDAALTPFAMAKHWSQCGKPPGTRNHNLSAHLALIDQLSHEEQG